MLELLRLSLPLHSLRFVWDVESREEGPLEWLWFQGPDRPVDRTLDMALWPLPDFARSRPLVRAFGRRRLLAATSATRSREYEERVAAREGWSDFIALRLRSRARVFGLIECRRGIEQGAFAPSELRWLVRLGRPLEVGLQAVQRRRLETLARISSGLTLQQFGIRTFLFNGSGRLLYASNPGAENPVTARDLADAPGIDLELEASPPSEASAILRRIGVASRPAASCVIWQKLRVARLRFPTLAFATVTRAPDASQPAEAGPARRSTGVGKQVASLSRAEQKVAELVATGMTDKEVAQRLGKSVRTVNAQVASILGKLSVANRTALVGAIQR